MDGPLIKSSGSFETYLQQTNWQKSLYHVILAGLVYLPTLRVTGYELIRFSLGWLNSSFSNPRKWQIFDIMHQEQMIMVRLQGQPFQYEEGCPIPVIHNDQSFILEPLLLKFFFAFLSIFFCISAGTTLCICGSSLVHQYLSIPCTKNNDNKDKNTLHQE